VAIYFGYRDLIGRVHQGRDSENQEVQKLSAQMEALSKQFNEKLVTFSTTLSAQEQNLGNTISGKLNTINDHIEGLNQSLKSINDNLKQTKSAIKRLDETKATKKNLDAAIVKLKADWKSLSDEIQSVIVVSRSLESVSSELKNLQNQYVEQKARAAENAAKLKKDLDTLQASTTQQLSEKIDKAALGVELLMYKKNQNSHSQEITTLNQRLDAIQNKIENLQLDSGLKNQSEDSRLYKLPPSRTSITEKSGSDERRNASTIEEMEVQEQDLPPE
jgi:chromosome segregation ATPase